MRLDVLLILVLLVVGGIIYYKDGDLLKPFQASNTASTTSSSSFFSDWFNKDEGDIEESEIDTRNESDRITKPNNTEIVKPIETVEVEVAVNEIYERLNELEAEARTNEILGPVSPYAASVTLKASGAKATDPDKEYLTLSVASQATNPINITGWTLESYVTNSEAKIPKGARLLMTRTAKTSETIMLRAGETANLITGETPINVSFKANQCSGYLTNYDDFTPSIKKSCALASDQLLQFGNIKSSDDECYEFVAKIKQCQVVEDDKLSDADVSNSCEDFIDNELTYNGCVSNHKNDIDFATGDWYIYLNKRGELWRSKKEIIRLLDADKKVVAVVEY